jgi:curved DNA-binding protein CbpA
LVKNHYQTLGVSRSATHKEIKSAYRALAIRYHPDVTRLDKAKAEEWFKLISEAYWVLKDSKRRREYNLTLPPLKKKTKVIYAGPPPWERQKEEDWIWDDRQLRYRRKVTSDRGMSVAHSPFSFLKHEEVYRIKTPFDKFKEGIQVNMRSFRFWVIRRARISRLRYRLFLDWINKRRLYSRHFKHPHKKTKTKLS